MGATVTTNKAAAAMIASDGEVFYVLFEETYEKNCYPHRPHWGCIGFGNREQAIRKVFDFSSSCEGGSLQSRSGCILPESYIAAWMKVLEKPLMMETDAKVGLDRNVLTTGFPEKFDRDGIANILGQDMTAAVENGERFVLNLQDNAATIAKLLEKKLATSWRLFAQSNPMWIGDGRLHEEFGIKPKIGSIESLKFPDLVFMRLGNEIIASDDGKAFKQIGWDYIVIGNFIQKHAVEAELLCTGSAKKLIKAYRQKCHDALSVDPNAASVTYHQSAPHYNETWYPKLMEKLGVSDHGSGALTVPMSDVDVTMICYNCPKDGVVIHLKEQAKPMAKQESIFAA